MVQKTEQIAEPVLNRCVCGKAPEFGINAAHEVSIACKCGRTAELFKKLDMTDDQFKRNLAMIWNNNVGESRGVGDNKVEALYASMAPVAAQRYLDKIKGIGMPETRDTHAQGFVDGFCDAALAIMNGDMTIKVVEKS
jgi:hypothetical protein